MSSDDLHLHPMRRRTRRRAIRWAMVLGGLIFSVPLSFVILPAGLSVPEIDFSHLMTLGGILLAATLIGVLLARLVIHLYFKFTEQA